MFDDYVIGKDFNTKDWWVYEDATDEYIFYCDTEEECIEFIKNRIATTENN